MTKLSVLLVGAGGREHALAWAISKSPLLQDLYVVEDNPGFQQLNAKKISIDDSRIAELIDLVIIGPELPLFAGLADFFRAKNILVFGPSQQAAVLEGSKAFAKDFMKKYNIPTARYGVYHTEEAACAAVYDGCVVKADGLAAGKGVTVCETKELALVAIKECFAGRFGEAGHRVVIEKQLQGKELSIMALCDGDNALLLQPCRDHKRRYDDDQGPNTGGMGAICPPENISPELMSRIEKKVFLPTLAGMKKENRTFIGALYAGLMIQDDGQFQVLEFNVRFGDPETQALLFSLDEDWLSLFYAAASGTLEKRIEKQNLRWKKGASCVVILSAADYPYSASRGVLIQNIPENTDTRQVFFSGIKEESGQFYTNGGRVLGICIQADTLKQAIENCYQDVKQIVCHALDYRHDIGRR